MSKEKKKRLIWQWIQALLQGLLLVMILLLGFTIGKATSFTKSTNTIDELIIESEEVNIHIKGLNTEISDKQLQEMLEIIQKGMDND